MTDAPWPSELRLSKDKKTLTIAFEGDESFALPAEYLRVKSPSAEVQGHSPDERKTVPGIALVAGLAAVQVVRRARRALWAPLLATAAIATSVLVVHPLGILGLVVNAKLPLGAAVVADLPFLPGDILKSVVAGVAAAAVHRAFPDVLVRRARRVQ